MMASHLRLLFKGINCKLVISCILSLSLAQAPTALAEYKPPPGQPAPTDDTTTGGSRRGCENSLGRSLTVLAPKKHVGQTASVHPTFAWFVPDTKPFPLEFKLFELDKNNNPKELVHPKPIELQSSPGIMKLSLPENQPGLIVGQRYLWQVTVICDPNSPSSDLVASAEVRVVEMPSALKTALSTTQNRREVANLYAEAGLWYEALDEALGSAGGSRLGQVASTLLEDLAKLEEPQQSQNLRQIVSSER